MKFSTGSQPLREALERAVATAPTKSTLGELTSIIFELDGDFLDITGADLEVRTTTVIEVRGRENGKVNMDGRVLFSLLQSLPECELVFELEVNRLKLRTESGVYHFATTQAKIPLLATKGYLGYFTIGADELKGMINRVLYSVSDDSLRPSMNGAHFIVKDGVFTITTTDGHRLTEVNRPVSTKIEADVVIPTKMLMLVGKNFKGPVTVGFEKNGAGFSDQVITIFGRLIDERFPNTEAVKPKKGFTPVEVDRKQLLGALKRTGIFSERNTRKVVLHFENEACKISTRDDYRGGEADEVLRCNYIDAPFTIGFNGHFLTEALSHMDGDTVTMNLSEPTKAVPMAEESKGDSIYTLVMPVRLNG